MCGAHITSMYSCTSTSYPNVAAVVGDAWCAHNLRVMCATRVTSQGKIEKHIMRKAFDTPEDVYLPKHILYRQKEQFSDGVGYNWIDELRAKAAAEVGRMGRPCLFSPAAAGWFIFG